MNYDIACVTLIHKWPSFESGNFTRVFIEIDNRIDFIFV